MIFLFLCQYICEEKFRYGSLSDSELVEFVNIFEGNLEKFKIFLKRYYGKYASELRYNIPILYRIAERIDQRKDYYLYFHSDEEDSMYMSQAKEVSLFCYWFIKYKPLSYKSFSDECHFFHDKGYTLNELYGAYVLMSFILGLNKDNCKYFNSSTINNLTYSLSNREISKESLILYVESFLEQE